MGPCRAGEGEYDEVGDAFGRVTGLGGEMGWKSDG